MELYVREKYLNKIRGFYHDTEMLKVIAGVRRCGKSCLLELIRRELCAEGIPKERILFLSLDSRACRKLKTGEQLEEYLDSFSAAGTKYLFIDDIQNAADFEKVLNALQADGQYSIFITGKSSCLLNRELTAKLTGPFIEFELFPLSFEEYLEMKEFYGKTVSPNLLLELNDYLREGGFPKTVQYDTLADKRAYMRTVIEEIFTQDVKKQVKIRNVEAFHKVMDFVIDNFGISFSIFSMQEALDKSGVHVKRETLTRYIDALVNSRVLYCCERYDPKLKTPLRGEKKYYLADTAFYFASDTKNRIRYAPVLENIVYVYARSRGYTVNVGRIGKLECDFILRGPEATCSYVQVAYTIHESIDAEDQKYVPLELIPDNYPKYVMTTDYLLQKRNGIRHVNLLEFMKANSEF